MKLSALLLLFAALLAPMALEAAQAPALDASALSPTASAPASTPTAEVSDQPMRFALGLGYPDVRLRYDIKDWALEAKGSFASGLQIYSGRLSWDFMSVGPLKALVGAEGGWIKFDQIDTISGTGSYGQLYVGLEYPFAKRLKLEVDGGPLYVQLNAEGQSVATGDLAFNAALYLYLW